MAEERRQQRGIEGAAAVYEPTEVSEDQVTELVHDSLALLRGNVPAVSGNNNIVIQNCPIHIDITNVCGRRRDPQITVVSNNTQPRIRDDWYFSPFAELKLKLCDNLEQADIERLAQHFRLDSFIAERQNTSGLKFIEMLEQRNLFSEASVDRLLEGLLTTENFEIYATVADYQNKCAAIRDTTDTLDFETSAGLPRIPAIRSSETDVNSFTPVSDNQEGGAIGGKIPCSSDLNTSSRPTIKFPIGGDQSPLCGLQLIIPSHKDKRTGRFCRRLEKDLRDIIWSDSRCLDHLTNVFYLMLNFYGPLIELSDTDGIEFHLRVTSMSCLESLQEDVADGSLAKELLQMLLPSKMNAEMEKHQINVSLKPDKDSLQKLHSYLISQNNDDDSGEGLQDLKYYCDYCKVYFYEDWQHEYHINSDDHKKKIASKQGNETWREREPPLKVSNGKYKYCENVPDKSCEFLGKLGPENKCPYAHTSRELKEWEKRHKHRLKIIQRMSDQSENLSTNRSSRKGQTKESKRWADMVSRIDADMDNLKAVGSLKYSKKAKIGTGSSGSHIFGGKFGNRDVAVKKIVNENVQREKDLWNLMKAKDMSNILKILHIEEDEDFTYVVTKLCEYDLKAVIEEEENPVRDNLTPEKRVKLCVDILRGLRDLHAIDVIHRDLKPNNILLDVNGDAFVADFGISRNLIGATTHVTSCYGTLCWIAYESSQSKNDKVRYKKESDVQVAGCLIYYILSNGHHPFEATSPFINDTAKLMSNVAEGNFSLQHVENYPQCTALLKRMLEQDMTKRPRIDDCLKEMEAVRKSFFSRTRKSTFTHDDDITLSMEGVTVKSNSDFVKHLPGKNLRKKHKTRWSLHVKCTAIQLAKVYLWHSRSENFSLSDGGQSRQQELDAKDIQKDSEGTYNIFVDFESRTRGAFNQWLILDFDSRQVLCQQFLVWVGPEFAQHFQSDYDNTLWDLSSHEVVKFPCSFEPDPLYEKLEELYPLPEGTSGLPASQQLSRDNYRDYFHEMVYDEEKARIKLLKQFNGFQEMDLKERLDEKVWVKPPQGQLFGEIKWKVPLDDSEASQILTRSVQFALLKFESSPETLYEAEIVAGMRLDLREVDRFVVSLSPHCVRDQNLKSGVKVSVNIQFKVDRKPFCIYHYAIDNLKIKQLLFPPRDMFPRFLEVDSAYELNDCSLNHRQEETRKFILSAKDAVPFRQGPSLIIGPFGTGKTLTLAKTVLDILEMNSSSKLLICTHSNSAADLFINELLAGCKQNREFHLLRVYAIERDPVTVEESIKEYSNYDFMGNKFTKPNAEEVSRCHVVVTTLATSIHFIDPPHLRGAFTHIFIDEAGQALETETMIPLGLAGPRTVVVLAGDHKQMRPKIFSKTAQKCNFHRSMLERLFYLSKRNNCNNFHFLTDNYRILSPQILAFIGEHCYHVKNFATAKSNDQQLASPTSNYKSMMFSAVSGEDKLEKISYYNEKEAEEIVQKVLELKANWPSEWGDFTEQSIAVLSPYKLQVQHLRKAFRKKFLPLVNVHTVQNSQGQQFKVVFISTVRTRNTICKDELPSPSLSRRDPDYYGVLSEEGELITALTRARTLLWVVGDPITLCSVGKCQKIWKEYIQNCDRMESLKPSDVSWAAIEQELAALTCTSPPIEEEDEGNVSGDITLYHRLSEEHIEPLQSSSSQDCDTETELEDIDDDIFDEIINELEKEVEKELSRSNSGSAAEPEEVSHEVSEQEPASRTQPSKPGKKKRRPKFRMLQEHETSFVKIEYKTDHSKLEGGNDTEVDEEPEEMDEAKKEQNIQLTIDFPDEYCKALLQFAENNLVHAIPLASYPHEKIVISSKRKRKRALDGDQVVLRKWTKQDVTYGEVMCILKRAEDLKWKKIVCTLDSENLGLMCPVDNSFLPKMFIYPRGIKKTGNEVSSVTIGLYSINPHQRRKIQHEKNVVVKSTEMANKLFVVQYLKWFDHCPYPMGIVTEELPPCDSLDVGLRVLRLKHGVRERWPASVTEDMKQFSDKWKIPKSILQKRAQYNFRSEYVFTIGRSDLSDGDFAIHLKRLQDGKVELGLHVADVPFFVDKDSPLDREVLRRGSSFFTTTFRNASHMLPDILSTNLCIFQQNKDRLSVSIILTLDTNLQVISTVFCRSLVCCKQNLTFEEVENYILNKYDPHFEFRREVMEQVEQLYKVMNGLPQLPQILHGAEIEDQINFPLAYGLVEGIRKLANEQVAKKLESLSEYKVPVCCQFPPKEEDCRQWDQTFKEVAHRIPHLPVSRPSEERRASYKRSVPVLQSTWQEIGQILDSGKDKMLELRRLLSCNEGFPQIVAALANLNNITPEEVYTCAGINDSQLGLQHFSKQEDLVHPFMAPVRSFMDLLGLRILVAAIETSENPYCNDDLSHIAYHCTKQIQSAKKYQKKAEMLVFAFKAKVIPHKLKAVVQSATEEELVFCYPFVGFLKKLKSSTNVPLHLLKPGERPGVGEVEGSSIQVNWKNRIYTYEGKMPKVTDNKSQFWLFTNNNVKNIPVESWEMMFRSVEQMNHLNLEDLENDWNQVNQRNTDTSFVPTGGELVDDITCEKMKTERGSSEVRKYVLFNRQFNPGDVVEMQVCSGIEQGSLAPRAQLFKMTARYDLCLEHRSMPVRCFTEMAEKMPLKCGTVEEYVETWLPMLRMMVAYNTIMSDETILIQDVPVKWSEENLSSSREIYGHFSLEKKWCDDRQILFSTLPKKKKKKNNTVGGFFDPTEKFLLSDFVCVRVPGRKVNEDQVSQLQKLGSKQNMSLKTEVPIPETSTIVVHGVSGVTNTGKPAETENYEIEFRVTQASASTKCLFDENAEQNQDVCTVELIPKPEPEKRMEVALANVKGSSDLIRSIILQNPEDIANSVDGKIMISLIKEGRKIGDKSFKDFFAQQPPNESQTEALKMALSQPFTVIQGPPGTGKTRTGAYLTTFFAQINKKVFPEKDSRPQILYCGPSNKSVDVIALYLQKFQRKKLRYVRVYSDSIEQQTFPIPGIESAERKFTYVEDAHMAKEIRTHALHHIIRSDEAGRNGKIIREMDRQFKEGKLEPSLENVRRYKEMIKNTKIAMLKARDIILCTCNAAGHFILKENLNIVQCIIDEAGMCFELDNLIPLVGQQPKQVVLIGDHKQLRPIIQNPRAKQLGAEISLMEKFKEEAYTLKIQYRMHEEICKFPSQEFYDDQLITDESVRRRKNYIARRIWPGEGHPRVFCHIEGEEDTQTVQTSDGHELSKSNWREAEEVVSIAQCLTETLKVHEDNIVILSQYNLQCKLIRDRLKAKGVHVKVQTIIKSQGSEWDYVLLSTVRSLPEDEIPHDAGRSWRRKNLGFIEDENQMNVGLTRAMRGLIIVGNKNLLVTCNKWKKLIQHYQKTGSVVPAEIFLQQYR